MAYSGGPSECEAAVGVEGDLKGGAAVEIGGTGAKELFGEMARSVTIRVRVGGGADGLEHGVRPVAWDGSGGLGAKEDSAVEGDSEVQRGIPEQSGTDAAGLRGNGGSGCSSVGREDGAGIPGGFARALILQGYGTCMSLSIPNPHCHGALATTAGRRGQDAG